MSHDYRSLDEVGNGGRPGKYAQYHIELSLFDMVKDPFEKENVIQLHPEVAKLLLSYANRHLNQFYL